MCRAALDPWPRPLLSAAADLSRHPGQYAERSPGIRSQPWLLRHHERVHRIAVVGCIGSGKSTAARTLAKQLGLEAFHLDRLWWRPGSYRIVGKSTVAEHTIDSTEFRRIEEEIASGQAWIIDGDAANKDDPPLSRRHRRVPRPASFGVHVGPSQAASPEGLRLPGRCPRQLPMGPVLDTLDLDDVALEEAPGADQSHRRSCERRGGHSSADPPTGPLLPSKVSRRRHSARRRRDLARIMG